MAISNPEPIYPPIAKAAHVQGTVVLHAIISKTGTIEELAVISGPPMLRACALDTVKQWRYKPYVLNGVPTEVDTTINVNFTFGDSLAAQTGTADNQVEAIRNLSAQKSITDGSGTSINTPAPTATEPPSEGQREQFAAQLSTNRKDSGEIYTVSGNREQVLEATVPGGSNVVALLANSVASALSAKGFLEIHITWPDGKGGGDEWLALISPSGYGEARSTMYCSITNQPSPGSKLCSDSKQPVMVKGRDDTSEARQQIAKTLTDQSAQHGRHNVYTACGKNGGQDGFCIVDPDAPEDGFVQRTGVDNNFGQMCYAAGFRTLLVSNGKGGYWGSDITSAGFVPMHNDGSSSVLPADPNSLPPNSSALAPSASEVGSLIEQAHSAALDEGAKMFEQKIRDAVTAREGSPVKQAPAVTQSTSDNSATTPPGAIIAKGAAQTRNNRISSDSPICSHETSEEKNQFAYDFVHEMLNYANIDRAKQTTGARWSSADWQQYKSAETAKRKYLQEVGSSSDAHTTAFWRTVEDLSRNFLGGWQGSNAITTQSPTKDAELNSWLLQDVKNSRSVVMTVKITVFCSSTGVSR
jgi:TonB family protein